MSYKYETQYNSPNYTPAAQVARVFGIARQVKGFTEHHWGDPATNPTYEGVINWLCRPGGNSSAHYVVDGPTRRVACIVSPNDAAWHSGNAVGNATTIGIENKPDYSDATYDVTAELLADLRDPAAYGDQLLYAHRDWQATACPGAYDINRIDQLSYTKKPGKNWGEVTNKVTTPPPPVEAEWVRNVKDITDVKLQVLVAAGSFVYDLNTLQPIPNSIIPRGTWVDIAKETTVGGKKFYISSYAATNLKANGILASELGIPETPPPVEKPEWVKNLQDIADKDMWTRSATPILNLADGKTVEWLPVNTKVRVTKATVVVGQNLLILDGDKVCIEPIYLSDTPITNPDSDIDKENNGLLKQILAIVQQILSKLTGVFK